MQNRPAETNALSRYCPPCETLFIYYFDGHPAPSLLQRLGAGFLGEWQEAGESFLFFDKPADQPVQMLLAAQPELALADQYQMAYEDWQGGKLAAFSAGDIHVYPAWAMPEYPEGLSLALDPGVVFGAGTHPTTRHCLEALQMAFRKSAVGRVTDIGTGTGILALAAAALGAETVIAGDFNFLAASTAHHNVSLNAFQDQIGVVQAEASAMCLWPADLLIANIHYAAMKPMLDVFFASKNPHTATQLILSGLLRSEVGRVEDLLRQHRVTVYNRRVSEGTWFTLACRRAPVPNQ